MFSAVLLGLGRALGETMAIALVLPFIPGDLIKVVLAGLITSGLARARPAAVLSRG